MGSCIAGGAYLPALSDVIFMVEGTSFMGLGGPNLVKGATGQTVDAETLGGARTHTEVSAVAHYRAAERRRVPRSGSASTSRGCRGPTASGTGCRSRAPPKRAPTELYDLLPARPPDVVRHAARCSTASSTAGRSTSSSPTWPGR